MDRSIKEWKNLTWQEKREERFKRWLNPAGVEFVSPEAKNNYQDRVNRFISAIKMEEGDRVPCMLPIQYFPAAYIGSDYHAIMYDYNEVKRAWLTFLRDFPEMDEFMGPAFISPGKIMDALDPKTQKWPGHGLPKDAWFTQFVEDEYMKADEYDYYMNDPADYNLRVLLPRTTGLFKPFERLPPLRSLGQAMTWVGLFSDPEMRKLFETLINLADYNTEWRNAIAEVGRIALSEGYPRLGGGMGIAPFDLFADMLRGTRGIATDMFRQPEKVLEAVEHELPRFIDMSIMSANFSECPLIGMPLHKGDDTFMSDKQFEKFYWPSYRKLLLALIDEGLVPFPFAEGAYNHRLKYIADMPKSGVVWYFDQTNMKEAKKILNKTSCIAGNLPSSTLVTGTSRQVKDGCRRLIEDCAPGGGYILSGGACADNAKPENLRAMLDAVYEYGYYK
jgi:hypothetical protein